MNQVLFFGGCDKTDLLLYVSKLLAKADLKVLLVDGTEEQIYSYSVPTLDGGYKVTEFEGFDVASGFFSTESLQDYFARKQENLATYDCILIDTDRAASMTDWENTLHHVMVTSLEKSSIQKNTELVKAFFKTRDNSLIRFFKIIVQAVASSIDEEYVESTLSEHPIQWTEPSYAVYLDEVDYRTKIENQFYNRLHLKPLSKDYKQTIMEVAQLVSELDDGAIKKALKQAERRN